MRLDVTSAKQRRRLVAELAQRGNASVQAGQAPGQAGHDAPLRPEATQPTPQQPSQVLVQWAQAALSVLLGLRLPLHGQLDATTAQAVRRFQGQHGLPANGQLDAPTVQALARAIGHPPPGMPGEHRLMPRWFRLDRPSARPSPRQVTARPARGPDDPWQVTDGEKKQPEDAVSDEVVS